MRSRSGSAAASRPTTAIASWWSTQNACFKGSRHVFWRSGWWTRPHKRRRVLPVSYLRGQGVKRVARAAIPLCPLSDPDRSGLSRWLGRTGREALGMDLIVLGPHGCHRSAAHHASLARPVYEFLGGGLSRSRWHRGVSTSSQPKM